MDNELDLVVFNDDEGNELTLEVRDYFFYNGQEYAVLADYNENEEACTCECEDCDHEEGLYIMKVVPVDDDQEEFQPVDESLMDELIEVVQTRFDEMEDEEFADAEDPEDEDQNEPEGDSEK